MWTKSALEIPSQPVAEAAFLDLTTRRHSCTVISGKEIGTLGGGSHL